VMKLSVVLLSVAFCTADKPPASPSTARPAKAKSTDPVVAGAKSSTVDSRPALRREGSLLNNQGEAGSDLAESEAGDVDPQLAAAEKAEQRRSLVSQVFTVVLVLVLRAGVALWTTMRRKAAAEGTAMPGSSAVAALSAIIHKSPLGPVLAMTSKYWAWFNEFARSPNAAPFMMGLLILSMKLVKRMDSSQYEEVMDVLDESERATVVEEVDDADDAEVKAADESDEVEVEEVEEPEEEEDDDDDDAEVEEADE